MSMIVKMQRRYGSEWYLKNDDGNVAWVAPMVKEHIERIEAENANLREELESVGMAAYLYGRGELRAENAKLRELVRHMGACIQDSVNEDEQCVFCPYQSVEYDCEFESRMQELGIEVSE